jgi:hypothetical protein
MEAVYRRLGVPSRAHVRRLVRPLRTYRKLAERLRSPIVARSVSLVADLALAWGARPPRHRAGFVVAAHPGRCGEEFTALARRVSRQYLVCVWRSADYLNWRYCDNPIQRHEIVTARLEGNLVAYVVIARDAYTATVVDLFGEAEPWSIGQLVRATVALLRRSGSASVNLWLRDSHPWLPTLARLGFRPRETAPVVVDAPAGSRWLPRVTDESNWFLSYGDRDS